MTPRTVPIPLMDKIRKELDNMEKQNVISKVNEPTEWCHPMVVVKKPSGDVRICVDLTRLNKNVKREIHPIPKIEHTLGMLANAKYFSKLDANSGFWQIPLSKKSAPLTTFLTPFGRYQFHRLPFGITSAPEHFQQRMNDILRDLPGTVCHMDDILIWGSSKEEHDGRLIKVLEKLSKSGVTLNKSKTIIGVKEIKFLGHIVSDSGLTPDPDKVKAVVEMIQPKNRTELQRFLGMVTFLGPFIPDKSNLLEPLNSLLKADTPWVWDMPQNNAFNNVKKALASKPILGLFDPSRKTTISADASSYGIGAVLLQENDDGLKIPIAFASRTMTESEKRYAQIEREALALTWACQRFQDFITGLHINLETDHKPLIPIFTSKNLDDLSPRLQRFRIRLMRFSFDITHVPGKALQVADALSRSPLTHVDDPTTQELTDEVNAYVQQIISHLPCTDERLENIWEEQQKDSTCQIVANYCMEGWPSNKKQVHPQAIPFYDIRDEITIQNGILMRACRLVIPQKMKSEILGKIHEGHLGINKCRARARDSCWWPGQSSDIEKYIANCPLCLQNANYRYEPMIPSEFPDKPWQRVAVDLFKHSGTWFLLVIDYYSRFPEVEKLNSLKTKSITEILQKIFCRFGIPEELRTDSGSQFQVLESSEFKRFMEQCGIKHLRSSPRYPQSNGLAEAGVKIIKSMIKKATDLNQALMAYRSTPLENGYSPSELLMGKKIRTTLPIHSTKLSPSTLPIEAIKNKERERKQKQKRHYDRRHGVRELRELQPGENVWVKDMRTHGKVVRRCEEPRSYIIDTDSSGEIRRNRIHLVPAPYPLTNS